MRVLRELAAVRRWRRTQRIATRLRLVPAARLAARRASRHELRTEAGQAGSISPQKHVNWMW